MIPISLWGGNLRPGPMDGSTTQNPNASRKPPCWMAACPMPRSWRFGKNQGKGRYTRMPQVHQIQGWTIFVLQKNGGRQGQTLLVLGSVSDVSVSLKQIYEAYHLLMNFERWYEWYLCTIVWRCWMIGWLFCQQIVPLAKTKRTSCDLWKDANFKKKATFHL